MKFKFFIFCIFLLCLTIADVLIGSEYISIVESFIAKGFSRDIIINFRIPKLITALLTGVCLSSSGLVMQTVFRNPLAGPYILGVSSGASLGVAVFMLASPFFAAGLFNYLGTTISAWLGAAFVLIIIVFVSYRLKDILSVLIVGMMIGSAVSAFVDVLQFFSNESALKGFIVWSMGSLSALTYMQLLILLGSTIAGTFMIFYFTKEMDVLLLGDKYATTMGVNVKFTRLILFIATIFLAGSVTAFCGPIAFVGLTAPHIARMIWKRSAHRILLPSSMLIGAIMMVICDILSSINPTGYQLPINTITALLGIPVVFIVIWNVNHHQN